MKKVTVRSNWMVLWGVIYAGFLTLGLFFPDSAVVAALKLTGIFLCLLYVVLYYRRDLLLVVALMFTFAADCILAVNNVAASGVMVFCFAQLAHFVRLGNNGRFTKWFFGAALVVLVGTIMLPADVGILIFGVVYGVTLISNLILAILCWRDERSGATFSAMLGFILFIGCDINVAMSYATTIGVLPGAIYAVANYMAWVFYLPSQILLAQSSKTVLK